MWAAAPAELEVLAPEEVPLAAAPDPDAPDPEPEPAVGVALIMEVMDPDLETVTVLLPYGTVFKPVERPAGKEAARGWDVTTAGWEVTATAPAGWEVTTAGPPVMMPTEFVSVRYWVFGFEYAGVEEDSAETAAAKTAEMMAKERMLTIWRRIIFGYWNA
jgi:hypothetical protein